MSFDRGAASEDSACVQDRKTAVTVCAGDLGQRPPWLPSARFTVVALRPDLSAPPCDLSSGSDLWIRIRVRVRVRVRVLPLNEAERTAAERSQGRHRVARGRSALTAPGQHLGESA